MVMKLTIAGVAVVGALVTAIPAAADPEPTGPVPVAADPAPPDQPVLSAEAPPGPVGPPAPPPVPEMANPVYGSGQYGSGPLGTLRDLWHQAQNPYQLMAPMDPGELPPGAPPPTGAGPAPALPPGFRSLNAPGSETASTQAAPNSGGPALPPGYFPITGPPPPGYEFSGTPGAPAPSSPDTPIFAPPPPAPPAATGPVYTATGGAALAPS